MVQCQIKLTAWSMQHTAAVNKPRNQQGARPGQKNGVHSPSDDQDHMVRREEVLQEARVAQAADKAGDPAHEQQRWMASAETCPPANPLNSGHQPLWGTDQFRFLEMHYPRPDPRSVTRV